MHEPASWESAGASLQPGQISTPTPSQHNGQRSQPGLPSYQSAPDCLAMAQYVRLWAGLGLQMGEIRKILHSTAWRTSTIALLGMSYTALLLTLFNAFISKVVSSGGIPLSVFSSHL